MRAAQLIFKTFSKELHYLTHHLILTLYESKEHDKKVSMSKKKKKKKMGLKISP